jgi:chlorobactene glucosyltransferase
MQVFSYLYIYHQVGLLVFLIVLFLIAISNITWFRRLDRYPGVETFPKVSVLVPARNEEGSIVACLEGLINQDYPNFEVIILDDNSLDRTALLVEQFIQGDQRLQWVKGKVLPEGWLGKHWACHQLAEVAQGDYFLFLDADTILDPPVIREAVNAIYGERADFISVLPHENMETLGEKLVQPFFLWAVFSFMPLSLAYRLRLPVFAFAIGQFLLFRRSAYALIGGHAAIRDDVVDDLALARKIAQKGLKWRLVDGGMRVTCRMYHSLREVISGFSKNYFAAFGYNLIRYSFIFAWLLVAFLGPILVVGLGLFGIHIPHLTTERALIAILLSLGLFGLVYYRLRFPIILVFFYPLTILLNGFVAIRSLIQAVLGISNWKGRTLGRRRLRLF